MTTNTIANLTTEQLEAYQAEYTAKIQTSFKSFDEKEFNSYYEAAKNEYLFNNKDEMDIPLNTPKPSTMFRPTDKESKGVEWDLRPYNICHSTGDLYKYLFVEIAFSHQTDYISFFKQINAWLEDNKEDYILCEVEGVTCGVSSKKVNSTHKKHHIDPVTAEIRRTIEHKQEIQKTYPRPEKEGFKGIPVMATKSKIKKDLKAIKEFTLTKYREYINLSNEEAEKELGSLQEYIQNEEQKKNEAYLLELENKIREQQTAIIKETVDSLDVDNLILAESFDFDISSLQDVIDDVKEERLENKFKMKDLTKALTNSVVEGDIDFIDINNDRVVSETLKAQGFEKKHTNTGAVWFVA